MSSALNPGVHASWRTRFEPSLARIDVAGFIGIAGRGDMGTPVAVESWPQFVTRFGDFQANAFLGYAVRGFFDNGGQRAFISRVVAPELKTHTAGIQAVDGAWSRLADTVAICAGALGTLEQDALTAASGAQPADRLSSIVAATSGFMPGAAVALRQAGKSPALVRLVRVDAPSNTLFWQAPIDGAIDLTQPFTLSSTARDARLVDSVAGDVVTWTRPLDGRFDLLAPIAAGFGGGTSSAILWDEEGDALLKLSAASPGRWGDRLSVRLTTSLASEVETRRRPAPDPANRLTLTRVDNLAEGSSIDVLQDGAPTTRNTVASVDTADAQLTLAQALAGFDLAGAANGTKPIRVRRREFALSVREGGRLVETFAHLDLPTLAKPASSPVNASSAFIRIERSPGSAGRWPDPGSPLLDHGEARLWGGRDGIAMLRPKDLTGGADEPTRRGLAEFEVEQEPAALAIPDLLLPPIPALELLPPEPPKPDPCELCPPAVPPAPPPPFAEIVEATPLFSPDDVAAVQQALVDHCENSGIRIALLDPPPGKSFDRPSLLDWRRNFDSSYAAVYFPWIWVTDPIARPPSRSRLIPPSGHVLGQFATADADPGRDAPANRLLAWIAAAARNVDDDEHALLNERGINAILARPGRGLRIMGARTMSSEADWKQLVVRRLIIRLKRSLALSLRWAVFEPANRQFQELLVGAIESLLEREWEARRLAGSSAEEAFQVAVRTSADDVDSGRFIVDIAVAPAVPAEFVFLELVRSLDRLELGEATGTGGWPK